MPWSKSDVEKHKKGLSQQQKAKWVRIANGVLEECKSSRQENCEQRAIRVANSKVGESNGN
jgi:uncharacterized protein YdaT